MDGDARELSAEIRWGGVLSGGSCTAAGSTRVYMSVKPQIMIYDEADKPLSYRVYIFVTAVTCISAQIWMGRWEVLNNGTVYQRRCSN